MLHTDFDATLTPVVANDATVADARRLMVQSHLTGLPVIDPQGKLLGIVTEEACRRFEDWLSVDQIALFHPTTEKTPAKIARFPGTRH